MRTLLQEKINSDLVVVGGGLAGVCCAITAARQGLRVALVQDRPVLGGNSSSEVRLWVLGATSHMGNNNRWAREGGVIDEILVENMWRNQEGNPVLFDSIVLEWAKRESNITLLLNTAVHEIDMADNETIRLVRGFCSQNQTAYVLSAPLFVDASGDGILGFLAGAEFRMGAEAASEFGEGIAPTMATHELLGHSLYFYSRDTGRPVRYVPPAFALQDITKIPRFRELRVSDSGCRLWWLEYGGNLDTVRQTEEIKWELWSVAYGVWNYIKNSGNFPDAENLTLEWMGMIPGKRESRRFMGDTILTQPDIINQTIHPDAVSVGGWAIDLHPSDGVYSPKPSCEQWHAKGVFQIPYRALYSRNITNLFLAGRLISASHIAFGSTRVMGTCAHNAQAVGMAARICRDENLLPRDLVRADRMHLLQQRLLRAGQYIPGVIRRDDDIAQSARVTASSTLAISELVTSGEKASVGTPYALLLPVPAGPLPGMTFSVEASSDTTMIAELWDSSRRGNTTPDRLLDRIEVAVTPGTRQVNVYFNYVAPEAAHLLVIIPPFANGALHLSTDQHSGLLTLTQKMNAAVAKSAIQSPPEGYGVDTFPFWLPDRRPDARNLAVRFTPALLPYAPDSVTNGIARPWCGANAWVPDAGDDTPQLHLDWEVPQTLHSIEVSLDTDFDHPMESVLLTHADRVMPGCVTAFRITSRDGELLGEVTENHQTTCTFTFVAPVTTLGITLTVLAHGPMPPAVFEVRCY